MHVAHYHMMCAYVTWRGTIGYYIRCMKGDPVLSVCDINGRERLHAKGFVNVPVKLELMKWNKELYDPMNSGVSS